MTQERFFPMWRPTPLEIFQATLVTCTDPPIRPEAIMVYGAPARNLEIERDLLHIVAASSKKYGHPIVLNGLTTTISREKNTCYGGHERWLMELLEFGIDRKKILLTPPALHTAEESMEYIATAREYGWKRITICSWPHHQLRCFLQMIACMTIAEYPMSVHNQTLGSVEWNGLYKKLLLSGECLEGSMEEHTRAEFERIIAYAQDPSVSGKTFTRHATIPEMFTYLSTRK